MCVEESWHGQPSRRKGIRAISPAVLGARGCVEEPSPQRSSGQGDVWKSHLPNGPRGKKWKALPEALTKMRSVDKVAYNEGRISHFLIFPL
ncbi:hypothetical protein Krac_8449 [Ktedonobacter racemifer DSM 44963]|uniref:Uncharacterized protein n=1 Tax=Ktedonobacter racemifer DSM 44963 TaxID=485913 RepID=D6TMX4_KTERA|nr:hypothetical protein Krac_8449 [Ktedonobacter racemifer DSM 44963]